MRAKIRRYFIAGLLVWLPIWATYVVVSFLINLMDGTLKLIPHKYRPDVIFGTHIPGLGFLFTLVILFITGIIATNYFGHRFIALWEKIVSRIPLIRTVYHAVKQVLSAMLQPAGQSFRKVLLIEYPRREIWSIAFQTSNSFKNGHSTDDMVTVFIPTTPNPTSGFLTIVPKKDVIELDMTVEEALRMVISLGVVMPPHMSKSETLHPDKQDA